MDNIRFFILKKGSKLNTNKHIQPAYKKFFISESKDVDEQVIKDHYKEVSKSEFEKIIND